MMEKEWIKLSWCWGIRETKGWTPRSPKGRHTTAGKESYHSTQNLTMNMLKKKLSWGNIPKFTAVNKNGNTNNRVKTIGYQGMNPTSTRGKRKEGVKCPPASCTAVKSPGQKINEGLTDHKIPECLISSCSWITWEPRHQWCCSHEFFNCLDCECLNQENFY